MLSPTVVDTVFFSIVEVELLLRVSRMIVVVVTKEEEEEEFSGPGNANF